MQMTAHRSDSAVRRSTHRRRGRLLLRTLACAIMAIGLSASPALARANLFAGQIMYRGEELRSHNGVYSQAM